MCDGENIKYEDIRDELSLIRDTGIQEMDIPDEGLDLDELEKTLMKKAMEKSGNVAARAARLLGMSYKTFWYRWDKYGLSRDDEEGEGPS